MDNTLKMSLYSKFFSFNKKLNFSIMRADCLVRQAMICPLFKNKLNGRPEFTEQM